MTTSLVTILACIVVMVSSAFALFYSEVSTDSSTLQGAYYSITVDNTGNGTYTCPLAYEDKHTFVIRGTGTATTGYCVITVGDETYTTPAIPQGEQLTVTITAAQAAQITFTPVWGASPATLALTDDPAVRSHIMEIYHSETPHTLYTVEPCARISAIAAHYGVSESDILLYNGFSDASALNTGTVLKIPGVPSDAPAYAVPFVEYTVEPTASLAAIAAHYSVSETDIEAFNGIEDASPFRVGMTLKIPYADSARGTYAVPYAAYTVEPNAVFSDLASHYGIAEWAILAYNGMTVGEGETPSLTEGTVLRIPGVSADTEPYAAPVPDTAEPDEAPPADEMPASGATSSDTEQSAAEPPVTETPAAESTPTGETPAAELSVPDTVSSDGEDHSGEASPEEPASAADAALTDAGAAES